MLMEELIVSIANAQNLTRNEAIRKIFDAGVEILTNDPKFANDKIMRHKRFAELFDLARKKRAERKEFSTIYHELGPQELTQVAQEIGVELDAFLQEFQLPLVGESWSSRAKRWLCLCLGDHKPHHVDRIKEQAIEAYILSNPSKDPASIAKIGKVLRPLQAKANSAEVVVGIGRGILRRNRKMS